MNEHGPRWPRNTLHLLVFCGGLAALSWELIWQLKSSLALGASASGTAITLAATMGGMTAGALCMGFYLRRRTVRNPVRWYGLMEMVVGFSGLALAPAFLLLERLDSTLYVTSPLAGPILHVIGIVLVLGPPTIAMGATIPIFGLIAPRFGSRVSTLYGLNTFGAGLGVLLIAFVVLPTLGVFYSSLVIAGVNFLIGAVTWFLTAESPSVTRNERTVASEARMPFGFAAAVVFITGFATFGLEVAWFRSLRAAYLSTTYSFAILLAAILIPLAVAARLAPLLRKRKASLGPLLAGAGALILLATPIIERFDVISRYYVLLILPSWFVQSILVMGPPMLLLGVALPWILDQQQSPRQWGMIYGINTLGAIFGAILAAWVLLPALGFARTAWLIGALVMFTALPLCVRRRRWLVMAGTAAALLIAVATESGVGRDRVIGIGGLADADTEPRLVAFRESPDSTISVIEVDGQRGLYIDGFMATAEIEAAEYMVWMGRLPMLLHPRPESALVICFGTGQTANAVRAQDPVRLDLVDINQAVFDMAGYFPSNEGVLDDARASAITMDGRAWLRRTEARYDVVTLEPMPPTFAGVNALYSREFYESIAERLTEGGVVAQWLPFHLVDPYQGASIAATFQETFEDSFLWIDPGSGTGILLGRRRAAGESLASVWYKRGGGDAEPTRWSDSVTGARSVDAESLGRYAQLGDVITDDNQLLSYGWSYDPTLRNFAQRAAMNDDLMERAALGPVALPNLYEPPSTKSLTIGTLLVLLLPWFAFRVIGDLRRVEEEGRMKDEENRTATVSEQAATGGDSGR